MVHLRSFKCYTGPQRRVNHCLAGADHYSMLLLTFINVAAYIAEQTESSIPRNRF